MPMTRPDPGVEAVLVNLHTRKHRDMRGLGNLAVLGIVSLAGWTFFLDLYYIVYTS